MLEWTHMPANTCSHTQTNVYNVRWMADLSALQQPLPYFDIWINYLTICNLFNDDDSNSEHITSNGMKIKELEKFGKKWLWHNDIIWHLPGWIKKIMKALNHDNLSLGQNLTSKCERGILNIWPWHLVGLNMKQGNHLACW